MKLVNLQRIYAIFLRHFFILKRSPTRLIGIFYWSTLELFIWGVIIKYLHILGGDRFSVITVILGAVIFWNFFTRIQQGITTSFLEDVWSRNLVNLFATPLRLSEYLIGLILISIVQTLLTIIGMLIVAWLFLTYNIFQFGFFMLPFIAILFVFGISLGILTTAAILRFGQSVEMLAWSIPTLISPFAAIFYSVETLPRVFKPIAYLIPISHVFESMRSLVLKGVADISELAIAFGLTLIFFAISVAILSLAYRSVARRGLLTKSLLQ